MTDIISVFNNPTAWGFVVTVVLMQWFVYLWLRFASVEMRGMKLNILITPTGTFEYKTYLWPFESVYTANKLSFRLCNPFFRAFQTDSLYHTRLYFVVFVGCLMKQILNYLKKELSDSVIGSLCLLMSFPSLFVVLIIPESTWVDGMNSRTWINDTFLEKGRLVLLRFIPTRILTNADFDSQPHFPCKEQCRKIPAVNQYFQVTSSQTLCCCIHLQASILEKKNFFKISTNIDARNQYWYTLSTTSTSGKK
jgi:hypothetical protein